MIKRQNLAVFLLFSILLISFTSANIFEDSWKYITGNAITEATCEGCWVQNECKPNGFRFLDDTYCYIPMKRAQKAVGSSCLNDYECLNNTCASGTCVDVETFVEEYNVFKEGWIKLSCMLGSIIESERKYDQCLIDNFEPSLPTYETYCDNNLDDDANGLTDCQETICFTSCEALCEDNDLDGFNIEAMALDTLDCGVQLDCDDTRDFVYPGAPELPNSIDDDCDGEVDEDIVVPTLEICDNGIDDNNNGLIDCADPFCEFDSYCRASVETFSVRISSGEDDVEEEHTGNIPATSPDLEMVRDDKYAGVYQTIGLRFNGLTIPQGSNIVNAYIEFEADESDSEATSLIISAEDVDNAPTFTSTDYSISTKTKTTANTGWNNIPSWTTDNKYQTPDLSNVIQEVVSRVGWVEGNSLTIIVDGAGRRTAEAYNGEPANAPLLVINYSTQPECVIDAHCDDPAKPYCPNYKCVECFNDNQCGGGEFCQEGSCEVQPVPVDGDWTEWTLKTACDVECGTGEEIWERFCTNPVPANGGADCPVDASGNYDTKAEVCSPTCSGSDICNAGTCEPEIVDLTCSNLGGEICTGETYCQGTNITESSDANCCDGTCKVVPAWAMCSQCGDGLFNICDQYECENINPLFPDPSYGCDFVDDTILPGGSCYDSSEPVTSTDTYPDLQITEPTTSYPLFTGAVSYPITEGEYVTPSDADLSGKPQIAELIKTNNPGDTLPLTGEALTSFEGTADEGRDTRFIVADSLGNTLDADILRLDGHQKAAVTLPTGIQNNDVYLMWPSNDVGEGRPVVINKAELWWIGPDKVEAGEEFSVYGANLVADRENPVSYIYVVELDKWMSTNDANPYKADFVADSDFVAGQSYTIYAHNGKGGKYGWSEESVLMSVEAALPWGAGCDVTVTTKTGAAIQSALNNVGDWGTVCLEAGTYSLTSRLIVPSKIKIIGAGKDVTVLEDVGVLDSSSGFLDLRSEIDVVLSDLTIRQSVSQKNAPILDGSSARDVVLENIVFDQRPIGYYDNSGEHSLKLLNTERIFLLDSDLYLRKAVSIGGAGNDEAKNIFIEGNNFYALSDNRFLISAGRTEEISIINNTAQHYDSSSHSNGFGWGTGRFVYMSSKEPTENIYFAENNVIDFGGPRSEYYNQNAGEIFMFEFGRTATKKSPLSWTENSLTFSSWPSTYVGEDIVGDYVTIVEGKGFGQTRRVDYLDYGIKTIHLTESWNVLPDDTSVMTIGHSASNLVVYENLLDGTPETIEGTASVGVESFSGVVNFFVEKNNISDVRHGIYSSGNYDANTVYNIEHSSDPWPEPHYFNYYKDNIIENTQFGIHSVLGGQNYVIVNAIPYQVLYGNVYRNNLVSDSTRAGIAIVTRNQEFLAFGYDVYENNILENNLDYAILDHRGEPWRWENELRQENYIRNQIFVNNLVTGAANGAGYVISDNHYPILKGNIWQSVNDPYSGDTLAPKLEVPKRVLTLDGITTGEFKILNAGTSSLSLISATSNVEWLTVGSFSSIDPEGEGLIEFNIDDASLIGGEEGVITINTNGGSQKVTVRSL